MAVVIKKIINKEDWKKFKNWVKENRILSDDSSFFTNLLNINNDQKEYSDSFYEFYFFNLKILKNTYTVFEDYLDNSEKKIANKSDNLLDFFLKIFIYERPKLKEEWKILFKFLKNLEKYLKENKKNYNKEFEIVQDYWIFINMLFENKIKYFNNWILFINNHIYKKSKGFL